MPPLAGEILSDVKAINGNGIRTSQPAAAAGLTTIAIATADGPRTRAARYPPPRCSGGAWNWRNRLLMSEPTE